MILRRVAYVVNVFPKLSETFIASELSELRRRGVEVRILSLRRPDESLQHEIISRAGLQERTVYDPLKFGAVLRGFRPQLLHAHFATEPAAAARDLAEELAVPFTFTAHGYDIHRRPPPDFAQRAACARSIVTVSRSNARYISRTFGVPAEHIQVIPCGVDIDRFRPAGPRATPPHLLCVARQVPVKNLGLLLEACADLRTRDVAFRAVLVGDGKSREELQRLRTQLGLEEVVAMVGPAEQAAVLGWWQRASVAVLTSEREGMPVSLMEAAACGVPAVAPAVGGIPELVEDGVTGLLVPAGDRPALVAALERLLRDHELAARLGAAARWRAEERFSVRQQVDQLLALWAKLLRQGVEPCPSR
jgi:glycosyltransferase involved in cell wall biosynthesis